MKVGWGFTAVAQRVPRLAGLAWFPADWPIQVAVGRQALRLALKANVIWKTYLPFSLQNSRATRQHPNPRYLTFAPPKRRRSRAAIGSGGKKPCPF